MGAYSEILGLVGRVVPAGASEALAGMVAEGSAAGIRPLVELAAVDVDYSDASAAAAAAFPMDDEQLELMGLLKRLPVTHEMISDFLCVCAKLSG